jgi:hypothetical protein
MPTMTRITETPPNERLQYRVLAVLSLVAAGATGILSLYQDTFFQPYFGSIEPLLAILLVAVLGVVSLGFLHSRGWFKIFTRRKYLRGVILSATLATLFAIAVILVDLSIRFPRNLNVPPPQSLLFYPAMAYVAEISFHALPLSLLLILLGPLLKKLNLNSLVWLCVFLASLLEPIFQLGWGFSKKLSSWAEVYVGLHVFVFNLLQMYVFRRYDFVSMYAFRLVYYIHWHIIWGYMRLQLLF